MKTVLLTDHPWDDVTIEERVFAGAGIKLISGPRVAGNEEDVEGLVRKSDPAAILTCWAPVSLKAIDTPTNLAIVARLGVGLDNIAVQAATARGAWVTNVPDYCVAEVSDHAIGLLLGHFRGIARLDSQVKAGGWHTNSAGLERIADLTVGIIGLGRIGRETARKLSAFGCKVLAFSVPPADPMEAVELTDLQTLQQRSDAIILHVPLLPATAKLVDEKFIRQCAKAPLLINVSRGGLVDNDALLGALNEGRLRGAALDVVDGEPSPPKAILEHSKVLVTPHIAFSSSAALLELRRRACEEVVRVLQGGPPQNPCNTPVLETPLDGGVASDIRIVTGPAGTEVVKRALPKLKVAAEWYSDPARSGTEVAAIRAAAALIGPKHVPEILWARPEDHTFAMRLVEPRLTNWKKQLLAGRVDDRTVEKVGQLLGTMHTLSDNRTDLQASFHDDKFFHELRIEPFFLRVADRNPVLGPSIRDIAHGMTVRRTAFVHGDYSPKNLLADGRDVVILDFEVAHWGDPRFDVGFCLSHLMLKTLRLQAPKLQMNAAVRGFIDAYRDAGPPVIDQALVGIVGCLILARLDGASPVDYLPDIDPERARRIATAMIGPNEMTIDSYLDKLLK